MDLYLYLLASETQSAAVSLQLWISFLVAKHLMDYLIPTAFLSLYNKVGP
jgi:hypothetical protein